MSWYDWLTSSNDTLAAAGLTPGDRVKHCGHRYALSTTWAATVGLWGGAATASTIIGAAGVDRLAYENFKRRHHLQTCGKGEPLMAHDLSFYAYMVMEPRLIGNVTAGEAAEGAAKLWRVAPSEHLGMLAIEILLRRTDMQLVFELSGIDCDRFYRLKADARQLLYITHSQMLVDADR